MMILCTIRIAKSEFQIQNHTGALSMIHGGKENMANNEKPFQVEVWLKENRCEIDTHECCGNQESRKSNFPTMMIQNIIGFDLIPHFNTRKQPTSTNISKIIPTMMIALVPLKSQVQANWNAMNHYDRSIFYQYKNQYEWINSNNKNSVKVVHEPILNEVCLCYLADFWFALTMRGSTVVDIVVNEKSPNERVAAIAEYVKIFCGFGLPFANQGADSEYESEDKAQKKRACKTLLLLHRRAKKYFNTIRFF